jgi:hypothetical protein
LERTGEPEVCCGGCGQFTRVLSQGSLSFLAVPEGPRPPPAQVPTLADLPLPPPTAHANKAAKPGGSSLSNLLAR